MLHEFHPFGLIHLLASVTAVLAAITAVRRRRRLPSEASRRHFDRQLIALAILLLLVNVVSELLPQRFDVHRSLPVHVCDIVGLVAPLAILTQARLLRAILYYWGLGLSTQALLTPELQFGPASLTFWVFWVPHGMIVVLAVYDLAALRYRPVWKDYLLAIGALAVFISLIVPLNLWLGVNYAYVGQGVPGQPSVVDFLGPWPGRVFKLAVAVLIAFALMTLPWVIASRSRRPSTSDPQGDQAGAIAEP